MIFSKEVLRELRQRNNYSLEQLSRILSKRCGCNASRSAIWQWEQGKTKPKLKSLVALAEAFGVEPSIFLAQKTNK